MKLNTFIGVFGGSPVLSWLRPGARNSQKGAPHGMERRRSERVPCDLNASCIESSLRTGEAWPAKVRDMSVEGMGLLIFEPFPVGTFLGVQVHDESGDPRSRVLVRVVHATPVKSTVRWLLGCEIVRELPMSGADFYD